MNTTNNTLRLVAPCDLEQHTAAIWKMKALETLDPEVTTLEIDLSQTRSMDSSGLTALVALNDIVTRRNGQVRLINPSSAVTQLLELTRMHRMFVIANGPALPPPGAHRPILVVEDEFIIRSVAEMSLKPLGRPIIFAENGQEAINFARQTNPAVILLDYVMPLMDGVETLRRLKSDDKTSHIPVIIVSANEKIAKGVYDKFEGASCFVSKPFSPAALRAEVHQLIQGTVEAAA
jgi:anti-anti-sigma factor